MMSDRKLFIVYLFCAGFFIITFPLIDVLFGTSTTVEEGVGLLIRIVWAGGALFCVGRGMIQVFRR